MSTHNVSLFLLIARQLFRVYILPKQNLDWVKASHRFPTLLQCQISAEYMRTGVALEVSWRGKQNIASETTEKKFIVGVKETNKSNLLSTKCHQIMPFELGFQIDQFIWWVDDDWGFHPISLGNIDGNKEKSLNIWVEVALRLVRLYLLLPDFTSWFTIRFHSEKSVWFFQGFYASRNSLIYFSDWFAFASLCTSRTSLPFFFQARLPIAKRFKEEKKAKEGKQMNCKFTAKLREGGWERIQLSENFAFVGGE